MQALEIITLLVIGTSLLGSLVFIGLYSRFKWEKSQEGINIMGASVAIGALAFAAILRRLSDSPLPEKVVILLAWLVALGVMGQRTYMLIQTNYSKKCKQARANQALENTENNENKGEQNDTIH